MLNYLQTDNHHIPQRTLWHRTLVQALKQWRIEKPDLFVRQVYAQAGIGQ